MIFTLLQPSSPKWVGHLAYSLTQRELDQRGTREGPSGSSGLGTRNAPSGSTGLFIHIHKGDRRWSKWVSSGLFIHIHKEDQRWSKWSGSSSLFSYTKGTGDGHLAYSCAQRDQQVQKDIDVLFSLKLEHFAEVSSSGKPIRELDITVATAYYLHTCTEKTWR
jgi:hypothetical protein